MESLDVTVTVSVNEGNTIKEDLFFVKFTKQEFKEVACSMRSAREQRVRNILAPKYFTTYNTILDIFSILSLQILIYFIIILLLFISIEAVSRSFK